MTTLAYDKGWHVTVDGQEVETVKALGSVIAFYIEGEVGKEPIKVRLTALYKDGVKGEKI